ncbi:3-oxoacyl-[acyl-carrier-protein] synthase III C-terminal domain-containing protein [Kitasatospora sp. NPDC018058]|uniref:3-oxoacyl-[acyl-carrier-protein] synthase III C-terminal domain-containing protein n=1 Tax=Kitasatospora sp. NPDC018058 TaxID=3364025 RepID=UPI0037BFAA5F
MATVITSAAPSPADGSGSSIGHAAAAGRACLEQAGLSADDVDVLINVGVYRDSNIVEPSVAALIQKSIGINLDYLRSPDRRAAFSFDLMNGACGVLNAVQAADALLSTGGARRVMVVCADTHPSTDPSRAGTAAFPYASTGAALLLEHTGDTLGFGRVHHRSLPGGHGVNGYLPLPDVGADGRNSIVVDREDDVLKRMLALAVDSVRTVLSAEDGVGSTDAAAAAEDTTDAGRAHVALDRTLLVTSQPSPAFAARLAKRLGLASDAAVTVEGVHGDPHTSALVHGYRQALDTGRLAGHDRVLFLAVGAGLTSAASLYRLPDTGDGPAR